MSFICSLTHFIWSTAGREPWIKGEWEPRLFGYLGGILREHKGVLLTAGGMEDHVHVLASLPSTLCLADAAAALKANSSRFIHDELGFPRFDWQKGYAAFSVSVSMQETVRQYILGQKEHHARKPFQVEFLEFLDKHGIPYDSRYVFL